VAMGKVQYHWICTQMLSTSYPLYQASECRSSSEVCSSMISAVKQAIKYTIHVKRANPSLSSLHGTAIIGLSGRRIILYMSITM
jgi:hypothetical protein